MEQPDRAYEDRESLDLWKEMKENQKRRYRIYSVLWVVLAGVGVFVLLLLV